MYKQYTYKRVIVAFNNIHRKLFGILRVSYVNNNIDSSEVLVRKKHYSFETRLHATTNLLVQCIISSLFYCHSSSCSRWMKILNL